MREMIFHRAVRKKMDMPEQRETPNTPLWVKIFGFIANLASLLFLGLLLANMLGFNNGNSMGTMPGMGNTEPMRSMTGMGNMGTMPGMAGMGSSPGRTLPLWAEISGFIALVVVLLFFIALFAGVGGKSRGRKPSRTARAFAWLMPPFFRKLTLTTHIAVSVGWSGAVIGFLVLAMIELTSQDALMVRGTFLSMDAMTWFAIVPLALASLCTGLLLSLLTKWGLLRHYWVSAKLLMNVLACIIVLMYAQSLGPLTTMATASAVSSAQILSLRGADNVMHGAVALLALLVATIFSVYKPRGLTRYGQRIQADQRPGGTTVAATDLAQGTEDTSVHSVISKSRKKGNA